jgi:diguanylate cyclase (GGDEF)-like protein
MSQSSCMFDSPSSLFLRNDLRLWQDLVVKGAAEQDRRLSVAHSRDATLYGVERFGIVVWEANPFTMQFTQVSDNAAALLGYRTEDWLQNQDFWLQRLDPRDQNRAMNQRQNALLSDCQVRFVYRLIARDGRIVEVQEICEAGIGTNGDLALCGCLVPSDFKTDRNGERDALGAFWSMIGEMPGLMWVCDRRLNVKWSVGSDFSVLKVRSEHPRDANLFDLFPDEDRQRVHVSMHMRAVNGEYVTYEVEVGGRTHQVVLKPYFNEEIQAEGCLGLAMDITERKWGEERIVQLALTDPLTGLGNYRTFRKALDQEMKRASRTQRPLSLLLFDMDGLKAVNDSHGHLVGSRALCRLANALQSNCRAIDISARYGGDEFAVIMPETNLVEAQLAAKRICALLKRDEEAPHISASFGAALFEPGQMKAEDFIAGADRALYDQKHRKHREGNSFGIR